MLTQNFITLSAAFHAPRKKTSDENYKIQTVY